MFRSSHPRHLMHPLLVSLLWLELFFVSDTNISGSVLPISPPPSPPHNIFTIPNSIPQPPPINITILDLVTKTPIVSENQLQQQQQQHKPQRPPHSQILSSLIPTPSQDVFAPQPQNLNEKTWKISFERFW